MLLGMVDDWTAEGTVVSWYPTEASHASAAQAACHPAPVSYQQPQHLQHYRRQTNLGRDIPRLCNGVWKPGRADARGEPSGILHHQRAHTANLNEESPQIQSWRAFLAASAGAAARPDAHLCANLGTLQQTGCDPVHPSFPSAERAVSCSAVTDSWHAWAHSRPHLPKADQIVRRVN
jgi:hypothetical protein